MGFFEGFTTGFASSIDEQLKRDMLRTQDRIDGMGQYRVTRRRAEIEKKEQEKKELREVLQNLTQFTDGDEDKAIQLYNSAGKTISGGTSLYQELLKNKNAGKDVGAAIEFAEAGAEPGNFTDFISRNITPVSTLPVMQDEMEASGLYKLFKPDVSKQLMREVEEAAPLPDAPKLTTKEARVAQAKIDRTGFLAAEEAAETKRERERKEVSFQTAQDQATQSMDLARRAADRLAKLDKENASQQDIENARADLRLARERERLDLAVAAAEREAKAFVSEQEIRGLTIEERKLAIKKAKEAPKFSTYEAMLVAADQKITDIESIPADQRTSTQIRELDTQKRIRTKAIDGINAVAEAESTSTYTPSFAKQSIDSIINNSIKRQLQPVGLVKDIEGQLEYKIKGNELQYFDQMTIALDNVEKRVSSISDQQMSDAIQAERDSLAGNVANYVNANKEKAVLVEGSQEDITDAANRNEYTPGTIIAYKEGDTTHYALYTGQNLIF